MKKVMQKASALALASVILLTMLASLPVYAADYVLEDWLSGIGGDYFWGIMDQLYQYVDYTYYGPSSDDYVVYRNPDSGSGGPAVEFPSGGGGGGGGGRTHDILTQPRSFYSNSTIKTYNKVENSLTNIEQRTYNVNNSGTIYNTSTVYYYEGSDTYYLNIDNSQTVNNQYEITEIYYSPEYNTYSIYTTNSYNYYLTYAPTFMTVTYLQPGTGEAVSNVYYYQLPDGRNSWDLTLEEAFGMYYIYNAINYDVVVEDIKTMGLFHFDGDMADASTFGASAVYSQGGSHNYIEHSGFDRALYWGPDTQQSLLFETTVGGTLEFMLYTAAPTVLPQLKQTRSVTTALGYVDDPLHLIPASRYEVPGLDYFLEDGYTVYDSVVGDVVYTSRTDDFVQSHITSTYSVAKQIGALVSAGDSACIPLYLFGEVQSTRDTKSWREYKAADTSVQPPTAPFWWEKEKEITQIVNPTKGDIGIKVSADNELGYEFRKLPAGSWTYISVSGGRLFVNGVDWNALEIADVGASFSINKPAEWNNYWYLDELRVSLGSLYTDTYTPQGHPFDTNKVLVLPEEGKHGDIAVKSNIPVGSMRVGGARPTYPKVGDVYIAVEKSDGKHLVKSVQQYQTGGWQPVDASIRVFAEWVHLKDYDLKGFTLDEVPDPGGGETVLKRFEGTSIRFNGPANAIQKIVVHGKTYYEGDGTPSLDNPFLLYGLENPQIIVNGVPYTLETDAPLLDGDARSSEGTETHVTGLYSFTGIENFQTWGNANTTVEFASDALGAPTLPNNETVPETLCSHFESPVSPGQLWNMEAPGYSASYRFFFRTQHQTVNEFKTWLVLQHGSGHPVTVSYPLEDSTFFEHEPTVFANEAGEILIEGPAGMEVWDNVYTDEGGENPGGGDNPGGGTDNPGGAGGDEDSLWDKLVDTVLGFFEKLGSLITAIVTGIIGVLSKVLGLVGTLASSLLQVITGIFESLFGLTDFVGNFGAFLGSAFVFIPPEIIAVIVLGLSLAIILMIINFFR